MSQKGHIDPQSREHCLAQAAECERLAKQAATDENKQIFLELANRWRKLADDDLRRVDDPRRISQGTRAAFPPE